MANESMVPSIHAQACYCASCEDLRRAKAPKPEADPTTRKPRYSLIPWRAVPELVEVLEHGVPKHGAHGWRTSNHTVEEYIDKAMRHLAAKLAGQHLDPESKRSHLAHAAADLLIAIELDQEIPF